MHTALRILGWTIAVMLYVLAAWLSVSLLAFLILTPAGWLLIPAAILITWGVRRRLRQKRASAALTYIERAVHLNLPLPEMLASAAASETGDLSDRLRQISQRLAAGGSIANAIKRYIRELPPRQHSTIAIGEQIGRLPQVLTRAMGQRRNNDRCESPSAILVWSYPAALLSIQAIIIGFCLLFIIPRYVKIFEDFDTTLPAITVSIIALARWFGGPLVGPLGGDPFAAAPIVPGFVWLILLALSLWLAWILIRSGIAAPLWDPIVWVTPVFGVVARQRGMGDVCHVVEQSLAAGLPIEAALQEASGCRVNRVLRRRVARWARLAAGGKPLHEAAHAAGICALAAGMLAPAQTTGNVPEAFGFLRRHYDAAFNRLATILRGSAMPLAVLACSLIVAWFALAMFLPLIKLIWSVTPDPMTGPLL